MEVKMAIEDVKYDETDPKIAKKLEFLGDLNQKTAEKLTSWQDMYDELAGLAKLYMSEPTKERADFTIVMLWSFIMALESLPQEGDIVAIAKKMNEILVMRQDLHGASVFVGEEADQKRAEAQLMTAALLSGLLGALSGAGAPETQEPIDKSKLH